MAVHKLYLEEFDEVDYQLIAIHSTIEDYRLAYFLNQQLCIHLQKSNCDIHISNKEGETQFTRFIFEDEEKHVCWNLVQNQNDIVSSTVSANQGLFADSNTKFTTKAYLIPEFKKVDYFLKVENAEAVLDTSMITDSIKKIDRVSTVYTVEAEKIKSKNNLIF